MVDRSLSLLWSPIADRCRCWSLSLLVVVVVVVDLSSLSSLSP
jgi:hypothetical protein